MASESKKTASKPSSRGNRGKPFEKELKFTFDSLIREEGLAWMKQMPVPTAPTKHAGRHLRVLKGKAPFDFYGMMRGGRFIGMEAKHNDEPKTSLPIVAPKRDGSGLQYHQLQSLVDVANDGGMARIVWNNGPETFTMCNEQIIAVFDTYNSGGRKSIPAALFTVCEQKTSQGVPYFDWLCTEKEND